MNFISHYRGAMDRFARDHRPTQNHVALYLALFYHWNLCRFQTPMPVARDDIMRLCCMRVPRIFYGCIKDLHAWGYISYEPSHDNIRGTMVHMYRFDKGKGSTGDQRGAQPSDQPGTQPGDQASDQQRAQPLLNGIINDLNDINELNALNYGTANQNSNCIDNREQPDEMEKTAGRYPKRKSDHGGGGRGAPESAEEVKAYFAAQKFPLREAEKFYNYFGSIGWRVGRSQQPMHDWHLAANNWMLKAKQIDDEHPVKPGDIRVPKDRDYQQPL